jgi:hypothetical protein
MNDTSKNTDADWERALTVWSKAGLTIPDTRSTEDERFLTELLLAAAMFQEMSRVTTVDRQRNWSMEDGAQMCRELTEFLSALDDVVFERIARGGKSSFDPSMTALLSHLAALEQAFTRAPEAARVRQRKHEFHDPLVVRLAEIFQQHTQRKASVTTDWDSSVRGGIFVDFVLSFVEHFLPDQQDQVNARSIQRALNNRRNSPPDPLTD